MAKKHEDREQTTISTQGTVTQTAELTTSVPLAVTNGGVPAADVAQTVLVEVPIGKQPVAPSQMRNVHVTLDRNQRAMLHRIGIGLEEAGECLMDGKPIMARNAAHAIEWLIDSCRAAVGETG